MFSVRLKLPAAGWLPIAVLGLLALAPMPVRAAGPGIAVVRSPVWSPPGAVRDGASELSVMMGVARMQQEHAVVGVVSLGDRHGLLPAGGEQALHFLALRGVPVARLTRGGDLALDPSGLFIDGANLTEAEASSVMTSCLERFGPPPCATDPDHPTTGELAAIRSHLVPFHQAFVRSATRRVALR